MGCPEKRALLFKAGLPYCFLKSAVHRDSWVVGTMGRGWRMEVQVVRQDSMVALHENLVSRLQEDTSELLSHGESC